MGVKKRGLPGPACASNLVVVQQTKTISNHSMESQAVFGLLSLHLVIYMSSSVRQQPLFGILAGRCLANVLESF